MNRVNSHNGIAMTTATTNFMHLYIFWSSDHVTPLLWKVHWLNITERIQFRLCPCLPLFVW